MLLGLRTAIYPVPDLAAGKAWYTRVTGTEPYYDQPFYVGYKVGGCELGLLPDGTPGPDGTEAYWGVADAAAAADWLAGLGATPVGGVLDVGDGVRVAKFRDPFGNTFAVIENPHFCPTAVR